MRFKPLCGVIAFVLLPILNLRAQSIYQLVVFGDSLSDNGTPPLRLLLSVKQRATMRSTPLPMGRTPFLQQTPPSDSGSISLRR
jgi:hypothetical protein